MDDNLARRAWRAGDDLMLHPAAGAGQLRRYRRFHCAAGVLYQYKWITFALSAACIGYGFYKAYRPIPTEACADGTCARPMNRKLMRSILWIATAIVTVAMIFPYLTPYLLSY